MGVWFVERLPLVCRKVAFGWSVGRSVGWLVGGWRIRVGGCLVEKRKAFSIS